MRRLFGTACATGCALVALAIAPTSAFAQVAFDWQGQVEAGIGVTTNVANTPVPAKDAPFGTPYPHWDGYGNVSPGIQLSFESQRTTHTLSYVFDYRYFFIHHEANAISNSFAYALGAVLSPTVDLAMGINLAQTQVSAFNVAGTAQNAQPLVTSGGNNYLFTGVANQALHVAVSANNTFAEGLAFTVHDTLPVSPGPGQPAPPQFQTYVASGTLGIAHQFSRDSLGGELGTDALIFPEARSFAVTTPGHIDMVHRATLNWHHEFNPEWSSTLAAGVLVAYEANAPATPAWNPAGEASLEYGTERGTAGITFSHAAQPNLITQQLALVDTLTARAGLPLSKGWDISGAAAALASRALLLDRAGFGNVTYGVLVDAALGYAKDTLPLRFELRYQLSRQFPIGTPRPDLPAPLDIRRQNLIFAVTYFFPRTPAQGTHGPSLTPIPSPTSNPAIIGRREQTRGQMEDKDRSDAHDRREERGKNGGESGGGDSGESSK